MGIRRRRFAPEGPLRGELRAPPDKSISHRAALIAAMGDGETTIEGFLDAADTRSTLTAIRALGAEVDGDAPGGLAAELSVRGVGLRGPQPAQIDVGNAGTLIRLLPGWLAGQERGSWTLDGDESIRRRPVDRIATPLRRMGASISARDDRVPPVEIEGAALRGITYELPVASAQVKSCLLLAGLLADDATTVVQTAATRDHTERMLRAAGATVDSWTTDEGRRAVTVKPIRELRPDRIEIPGDISSVAFPLAAALLTYDSQVRITGVGVNPGRTGILRVLHRMGANLEVTAAGEVGGEPVADLTARYSTLTGTEVGPEEIPATIDELPIVALLGAFAFGETVVRGAEELRQKESDRIAAIVDALRGIGALCEARPDGFSVKGGSVRGGVLDARGDHRIAMLGAIAGIVSGEGVEVEGIDAAAVSYPHFERDMAALVRR